MRIILYLILGWIVFSFFYRQIVNKNKSGISKEKTKPETGRKKDLDIKDAEYEDIE